MTKLTLGFLVGLRHHAVRALPPIAFTLPQGQALAVLRDKANTNDPNAIQIGIFAANLPAGVRNSGRRLSGFVPLGYLNRGTAADIAPLLDRGRNVTVTLDEDLVFQPKGDPAESIALQIQIHEAQAAPAPKRARAKRDRINVWLATGAVS